MADEQENEASDAVDEDLQASDEAAEDVAGGRYRIRPAAAGDGNV